MNSLQNAGKPPVLFFSVSGLRGAGRSSVYHELKSLLPELYPRNTFAFIGNPFGRLPFPLLWSKEERDKSAVSRLFDCWSRLNDFTEKKVGTNLNEGHIVISDGFGLDALLYATACGECITKNEQAEIMHRAIVAARLVAQGLPAPEYLLVQSSHARVERAMLSEYPELGGKTTSYERIGFIRHEEEMIRRYFGSSDGVQHVPLKLRSASVIGMMSNKVRMRELAVQGAKLIGRRIAGQQNERLAA